MLFAISPGSSGDGPPRFVASVPFVLAPGAKLQVAQTLTCQLGAEVVTIERMQLRYVASLGPFDDAKDAEAGLERLCAALLWLSLELSVGLRYPKDRGTVQLYESPVPVPPTEPMAYIGRVTGWTEIDGSYDGDTPTIRPDHKRLTRFEPGQANITVGIGSPNFMSKIEEALRLPNISTVAANPKLRLAIELYASHRFEVSYSAKFIALVTALEALLADTPVSNASQDAVAAAEAAALSARDNYAKESDEWHDIERLLNRLRMLRNEAIGTSLRRFTAAAIIRNPGLGDKAETLMQLRDAYSLRSRLLHDGQVNSSDLARSFEFLQSFVPNLLRQLFIEGSNLAAGTESTP